MGLPDEKPVPDRQNIVTESGRGGFTSFGKRKLAQRARAFVPGLSASIGDPDHGWTEAVVATTPGYDSWRSTASTSRVRAILSLKTMALLAPGIGPL